jgi:hypothetical protein
MKKLIKGILVTVVILSVFSLTGCKEEIEPVDYAVPVIAIDGAESVILQIGTDISVPLTITSEDSINTLLVNKNGGFFEEVDLSTLEITAGIISYTYTGQLVDEDAEEGAEIMYSFKVLNSENDESVSVDYTISVARFPVITIGSTDLYDLSAYADGSLKLAEGRSYYTNSGLSFGDEGEELLIEPGVTIYMAGDTVDVSISGTATVNAVGTASAPIVFTSINPLLGEEAEVGDWDRFKIEGGGVGTNNGIIKYIRLEYSTDGLVLSGVGSGTEVSYIQVFKTDAEGLYISQVGDVNFDHVFVVDAPDRSFRIGDAGWGGFGQFLISWNLINAAECFYIRDGNNGVTLANVTTIGPGADSEVGDKDHAGIYMKGAFPVKVYNAAVTGMCDVGVKVGGDMEVTDLNGNAIISYTHVYGNNDRDGEGTEALWFTDATFNNSEVAIAGIDSTGFVPSTMQASEFDPASIEGGWFESAPFVGAIKDADNDWTLGWTRNPDGSLR